MLDLQQFIGVPKIFIEEKDGVSHFTVQYLPRGFGHTLGNALRRVMLGYDFGGAITGLKIKDIPHEYHVIDGVKETVVDIMLNLKKLRFKIDEHIDPTQWIAQKFSGLGVYTAQDLKLPSGVEVIDDDAHLLEITDPSVTIVFDIRVEKGYGYYSLEYLKKRDKKEGTQDIAGMILIDNDFKLVDYVSYHVDQVIDDFEGGLKDVLVLDVKMASPKVTAKDFLAFAGEVLASYAKLFIFDDAYIDRSALIDYEALEKDRPTHDVKAGVKTMPIDALPLSERTRNALIKNAILYVEDLERKKKGELLLMKGVGRKAIDEISGALANIGKALAG